MKNATPRKPTQHTTERQLAENARRCVTDNLVVHVDTMNAQGTVALCSVEQHSHGLFRRHYPMNELVWRAEQALSPLIGLGIVPLISVRHQDLHNTTAPPPPTTRYLPYLLQLLRNRLGFPQAHHAAGAVTEVVDPFGWQQAHDKAAKA